MVPPTRRRLLQTAAAVAGGLAGCNGLTGTGDSTNSDSSGRRPDESSANSKSDPPAVVLRAATGRPPIVHGDYETPTDESGRSSRSFHGGHEVIDSRSKADQLTVAPDLDSEEVTAFVEATDFKEATLYLETQQVEQCFRLDLCTVQWQTDEVDLSYVRQIRSWDERCATDQKEMESRLIRIPATLDADEVHGYGRSVSSGGSCDDRRAVAESSSDSGMASDSASGSGSASGRVSGGSDS